jgi:SMC interacting uncharacterized protein involved in chromosome segregation
MTMLDGFKQLFESLLPTQSPQQPQTNASRSVQTEMTMEQAEILFVKAGGIQELQSEIEELKQQLRLRTDQLNVANEDRSSLRRELSEVKENYAALREEVKRRREEPSAESSASIAEDTSRKKNRNK